MLHKLALISVQPEAHVGYILVQLRSVGNRLKLHNRLTRRLKNHPVYISFGLHYTSQRWQQCKNTMELLQSIIVYTLQGGIVTVTQGDCFMPT